MLPNWRGAELNQWRPLVFACLLGLLVSDQVLGAAYDDFLNAVKTGDSREVRQLLRRGVDANTTDAAGHSVLHIASRDGVLEVARVLVAAGADVDRRNKNQETPLMMAALGGHLSTVQFLLSKDAQINQPGWTALLYAATNGHVEIVRLLIENHAYIDSSPSNGLTSLMMATRGGHTDTVKLLLDEGADASLKNDLGDTAYDWAMRGGNTNIAALIKAKLK